MDEELNLCFQRHCQLRQQLYRYFIIFSSCRQREAYELYSNLQKRVAVHQKEPAGWIYPGLIITS